MATARRSRNSVALILASYPKRAAAKRAARELVERGLLACATLVPRATAFYRWEGKFHEEWSVLLWGKTTVSGTSRAVKALAAIHPDRVPEIVVIKTAGALPAYAAWVSEQVEGER